MLLARWLQAGCAAGCLLLGLSSRAWPDEVDDHKIDDQLSVIARAGRQGAGSAEARAACDFLETQDAAILPRLLTAMETPNPIAANWYRSIYEAIVAKELARPEPRFPVADLRAAVNDPQHAGRARRLALALCDRLEVGYSQKLIPKLLDDPEFRSDAVAAALAAGQQALTGGDSETARAEFQLAFQHSRDSDQTLQAANKLAALGEKVDIAGHLGLVVNWWCVGPFDAPQFTGFEQVFPPEQRVDRQANYVGQEGRTIHWLPHAASDPLGLVDLAQALGPAKEAVGYAYTEIDSPREQVGQLRCGADDNCTVWLNGQKVFARQQWLNGIRFDRFVTPIKLQSGKNTLLVKVCQGPQHKDPQVSNNWTLYLRLCDENGTGLLFRPTPPRIAKEKQ